ncbi:MAG: sensor histidine kinase [Clostridia bacterium]|nr:sensor histidine kinase [Clostridia bacterium]
MTIKIFKLPSKILDNLSYKAKLLLTYFILILLPLSLFTYITYKRVSSVVLNQTLASASQVFSEAGQILDKEFGNAEKVFNILTHNNLIYEVASRDTSDYEVIQQLEDSSSITDTFRYLIETTGVHNIKFYVNNNFVFSEENVNMFNFSRLDGSKWYAALNAQPNNTLWCPPSYFSDQGESEKHVFSAARVIYNLDRLSQKLAVLRVDLSEEKIKDALKNAALTPNTAVYIMDSDNDVLSSSADTTAQSLSISSKALESLPVGSWSTIEINHQKAILNYSKIKSTGWYLVSIIPQDDIMATGTKLRNEMLIYALILVGVSYLLAYFISNSSVKRLSLLTREMRKVSKGNLDVNLKKMGTDEIGELMDNFHNMVQRTALLLDEKYKMGLEIKSVELKALQAQINPHFLYNSLDLINCIAIKHNIPDIIAMVNALAKFYKLSLSKGNDIVPVKDELAHVQLYVQIQNMRFDNRIGLELDIEERLYEYRILKILLQPIVENSILHGIFEKESKSGTIRITGKLMENTIVITVADDGIGIPDENLQGILENSIGKESHGYGIKNIHQRIKIYYGEQYGLSYRSTVGVGTEVEVRIPAESIVS